MTGLFRIYFDSHEAAPLVVSVDRGTPKTEMNFRKIHCLVATHSNYDPTADQPKFWMECWGRLEVVDDEATIHQAG
jgi:hypothetical protein